MTRAGDEQDRRVEAEPRRSRLPEGGRTNETIVDLGTASIALSVVIAAILASAGSGDNAVDCDHSSSHRHCGRLSAEVADTLKR